MKILSDIGPGIFQNRGFRLATIYSFLICIYITSMPLYRFPFLNLGNLSIQWDWVLAASIAGLTILAMMGSKKMTKGTQLLIVCAALGSIVAFFLSGISPILSQNPARSVDFFTTMLQYIFHCSLFLIFCFIRLPERHSVLIVKYYLFLVFLICLFGIIQLFAFMLGIDFSLPTYSAKYSTEIVSGYNSLLEGLRRPTSVLYEPRHFGVYPLSAILITMVVLKRRCWTIISKGTAKLFLCVYFLGVLSAFSLSGYLVLMMGIVVFGLFFSKFLSVIKYLALLLVFFFVVKLFLDIVVDYSLSGYIYSRLTVADPSLLFDSSFKPSGILKYIKGIIESIKVLLANPFFGVGLNNAYYFVDYEDTLIFPFYGIFMTSGFLGGGMFYLFMAIVLYYIFRKKALSLQEESLRSIGIIFILSALIRSVTGSKFGYFSSMFWGELNLAMILTSSLWFYKQKKMGKLVV